MEPSRVAGLIENILIENDQISDVGGINPTDDMEVIDATDCIVLPGLIDSFVRINGVNTKTPICAGDRIFYG